MRILILAGCLCAAGVSARAASCRVEQALDDGWTGILRTEEGVVRSQDGIGLPHNWDDYHGYRYLAHGHQHGTATYARTFRARTGNGVRNFLVFEGAGSYLTVRVNGVTLCSRRPAGRIVTTLEATTVLRDGDNELEVVCDHPSDIGDLPWQCGGCGRCTCESPEPFGLFRSVRLETTGAIRVAPFGFHVWHDRALTKAFAEVELDRGGCEAEGVSVRVTCPELGFEQVRACDGTACPRFEFPLAAFERWSPDHPRLYVFRSEVHDAKGNRVDESEIETGFCTMRWPLAGAKDHRFILNGEPLFVHGASEVDHRFGGSVAFEPEEIDARCRECRKLNFNILREGHEPHDLRYMRRLQELGILYWTGFSTHNYVDTPGFRANFLRLLEQWVRERRNSPALAIWGLQNESTLPVEFARECVERIRALDPLCGPDSRPVVTCNFGGGTDWNVVQNWSGTYAGYGGTLMTYEKDLAKDEQLLNGEYGAWRLVGYHSDPDAPWDIRGPWTEEHHARILCEKLMRGWRARDRVCGQLQWPLFTHEDPGGSANAAEGYRVIDKIGPVNFKGIYSIWGQRTVSWYVYYAYGRHLASGDLGQCVDRPLSWWIDEGRRLAAPAVAPALDIRPADGWRYIHRLNCGGDAVVDSSGNRWRADDSRYVRSWSQDEDLRVEGYPLNPVLASQGEIEGPVLNAADADQGLLRTFRYGRRRFSFVFPVPTNAPCRVEMFFAEPGSYGRTFDIAIDGRTVETNFSIAACAPERNGVRCAWTVRTGTNGTIRIDFPRVPVNQALVSAVAIATDAESAAGMPAETRPVGYPECDGYSWRELVSQVRHSVPKRLLPFGGVSTRKRAYLIEAIPNPDRDGFHVVQFKPHAAGNYSVRFRVVGEPSAAAGKEIRWRLLDHACENTIATGSFRIGGVDPDGSVRMPLKTFVNAGGFFFLFQSDGDVVGAREMSEDD